MCQLFVSFLAFISLNFRLVACGAQGGSFPSEDIGNKGGCVIADIDLVVGTKLHLSIGQKGESPCDDSVTSSMVSYNSIWKHIVKLRSHLGKSGTRASMSWKTC